MREAIIRAIEAYAGMSEDILIRAQVVKAQTTVDGALRVTIDVYGNDLEAMALMLSLAHDQASIEFTPRLSDG